MGTFGHCSPVYAFSSTGADQRISFIFFKQTGHAKVRQTPPTDSTCVVESEKHCVWRNYAASKLVVKRKSCKNHVQEPPSPPDRRIQKTPPEKDNDDDDHNVLSLQDLFSACGMNLLCVDPVEVLLALHQYEHRPICSYRTLSNVRPLSKVLDNLFFRITLP